MKRTWKILRTILVWAICLMSLCPFVILLILSLDEPGKNMYDIKALIPDFYLGNYQYLKSYAKFRDHYIYFPGYDCYFWSNGRICSSTHSKQIQ